MFLASFLIYYLVIALDIRLFVLFLTLLSITTFSLALRIRVFLVYFLILLAFNLVVFLPRLDSSF